LKLPVYYGTLHQHTGNFYPLESNKLYRKPFF